VIPFIPSQEAIKIQLHPDRQRV